MDTGVYGEAWMNYSPVAEQMDFTCDERNNREARQNYVPQLQDNSQNSLPLFAFLVCYSPRLESAW